MSQWSSAESAALFETYAPRFKGRERLDHMAVLAELMLDKGLRADAARVCQMVLAESDGQSLAAQRARFVLSSTVPRWHYDILRDRPRLDAYARAIQAVVKPGMLVLDIGTGSGILAMMAARAGAELVVACEREPMLAEVATAIVARNGLSDRVRVINKESTMLQIGHDLPRQVDCVISEVISADLLSENVLRTMAAARNLMTEAAPTVPRRGAIHVALVQSEPRFPETIDTIAGFDLSLFNAVMQPNYFCGTVPPDALLSDGACLFSVDLSGHDTRVTAQASTQVRVQESGVAVGILQWIEIDLADGVSLETGTGAPSWSWGQSFSPLLHPVTVTAGQSVAIHGWRTLDSLLVWA